MRIKRILFLVSMVLLLCIGMIAWYILKPNARANNSAVVTSQDNNPCTAEPRIYLPVEKSSVTEILYPGQLRKGIYETDSLFVLKSSTNDTLVRLPIGGKLTAGKKYLDKGEVQFMLEFVSDCGYRMRFDHLAVVSLELVEEISHLSERESSTSDNQELSNKQFDTGTIIASRVGYLKSNESLFTFGFYNPNAKNVISSDAEWSADPLHQSDDSQRGLCWIDYLSENEKSQVAEIVKSNQEILQESDYCNV